MLKPIGCVAVAVVMLCKPAAAQRQPPFTPATSQTQKMSGSTVATLVSQDHSAIDLLVLWRGKPGWFMAPDYQASRGGSGPKFDGTLFFAGRLFNWDIDFRSRVAHIAGSRLDLKDNNVVLVDGIDAPVGPRIVKTLKLDADWSSDFPSVGPVIWRAPELATYLQCDQHFADPQIQMLHSIACLPITGPSPEQAARAVNLMLDRFAQLSREGDAGAIAQLYARDGEIANPGQDVIKGRAAIQAFLDKFAQYQLLEYVLTPTTTTGDKNGVTQTGSFRQRVRTPEGNIVEVSGTFTAEWILEDFVWHIRRMTTRPR